MKKVGIVIDNYKLDKFKKELSKNNFDFTINPFKENSTTITVKCSEKDVRKINAICIKLESEFKRSN